VPFPLPLHTLSSLLICGGCAEVRAICFAAGQESSKNESTRLQRRARLFVLGKSTAVYKRMHALLGPNSQEEWGRLRGLSLGSGIHTHTL